MGVSCRNPADGDGIARSALHCAGVAQLFPDAVTTAPGLRAVDVVGKAASGSLEAIGNIYENPELLN